MSPKKGRATAGGRAGFVSGATELYCPLCAAPVEAVVGVIDEPVMTGLGIRRTTRPGSYLLCTGCEWGDEIANLLRA